MEEIKRVIDKYFAFMDEINGNSFIDELVPAFMIDHTKKSEYDGVVFWKPINSTIEESEFTELEQYYRHKLPVSYKAFLGHRHFIELQLGEHNVVFFKNLPNTIVQDTKEEIEDNYKELLNRNYLPFAALSDHGVLCFDANEIKENGEYPIVSFDYEDETPEKYSPSFESMFYEFENHLDDWIKQRTTP